MSDAPMERSEQLLFLDHRLQVFGDRKRCGKPRGFDPNKIDKSGIFRIAPDHEIVFVCAVVHLCAKTGVRPFEIRNLETRQKTLGGFEKFSWRSVNSEVVRARVPWRSVRADKKPAVEGFRKMDALYGMPGWERGIHRRGAEKVPLGTNDLVVLAPIRENRVSLETGETGNRVGVDAGGVYDEARHETLGRCLDVAAIS